MPVLTSLTLLVMFQRLHIIFKCVQGSLISVHLFGKVCFRLRSMSRYHVWNASFADCCRISKYSHKIDETESVCVGLFLQRFMEPRYDALPTIRY